MDLETAGGWVNFSVADLSYAFLAILLEGVPFLLLGAIISGILDEFVFKRGDWVGRMRLGVGWLPMVAALGFLLPVCECATVPVVRRLMRRGLPAAHGVAFLLAAPSLNPLVALSTWAAFRGQEPWMMVGLRLGMGWLVATLAGFAVANLPQRWVLRWGEGVEEVERKTVGFVWRGRLQGGGVVGSICGWWLSLQGVVRTTIGDFLDVLVYFSVGAACAAFLGTAVSVEVMLPLAEEPVLGVMGMMGLAAALSVCSSSDAFVAAGFGVMPNFTKLAFLVFGPIMDIKLFFLYSSLFHRRFVLGLGVGAGVLVGLMSWKIGGWLLVY